MSYIRSSSAEAPLLPHQIKSKKDGEQLTPAIAKKISDILEGRHSSASPTTVSNPMHENSTATTEKDAVISLLASFSTEAIKKVSRKTLENLSPQTIMHIPSKTRMAIPEDYKDRLIDKAFNLTNGGGYEDKNTTAWQEYLDLKKALTSPEVKFKYTPPTYVPPKPTEDL